MGIAAGLRFYHTQNNNHLDQNIGLNKHKLILLVNDNTAEHRCTGVHILGMQKIFAQI